MNLFRFLSFRPGNFSLDNTTMLWALGAYFVYITIWLARFLMKFRKPRDA